MAFFNSTVENPNLKLEALAPNHCRYSKTSNIQIELILYDRTFCVNIS